MEKKDGARFPIDKYLQPAYYQDFHCLASACQHNCCTGWRITMDKKDTQRIKDAVESSAMAKTVHRPYLRRIRSKDEAVSPFYSLFVMREDGACVFYNEQGLCDLQCHCGEKVLPAVCRNYPRTKRFSLMTGHLERSLQMSCEGVLELLWRLPQGIAFVEGTLPETEHKTAVMRGERDFLPMAQRFADIRSICIDVLQCRKFPIRQRMLLLGLLLRDLSEEAKKDAPDVDRWLSKAAMLMNTPDCVSGLADIQGSLSHFLPTFLAFTSFNAYARVPVEIRKDILDALEVHQDIYLDGKVDVNYNAETFEAIQRRFAEEWPQWEYFFENIMVSHFFARGFPKLDTPEAIWESYMSLSFFYGLVRFVALMACRDGKDKDRLFYYISAIDRAFVHNQIAEEKSIARLHENESDTLAHMALFVLN